MGSECPFSGSAVNPRDRALQPSAWKGPQAPQSLSSPRLPLPQRHPALREERRLLLCIHTASLYQVALGVIVKGDACLHQPAKHQPLDMPHIRMDTPLTTLEETRLSVIPVTATDPNVPNERLSGDKSTGPSVVANGLKPIESVESEHKAAASRAGDL